MPLVLVALLYAVLLVTPIPLPFISAQVRNLVMASMPPHSELELGEMALALEGYALPVIQFTPVTYRDTAAGGKVHMEALEVGFSPIRALIGQPGATVTMVGPHIQVNQDLFGPRLAEFEVVPDAAGGPATVRVLEGSTAFPDATFQPDGIDVNGETTEATHMRSDNDWLVFNLEAAQASIAGVIEQAEMGRFSRLVIRGGTADMNDAIYQSLRTFTDISLDVAPTPNGRAVEGDFSANFGGTVLNGIFERLVDDKGEARLKMSLNNFDLAAFAPTINDRESMVGIVGPPRVARHRLRRDDRQDPRRRVPYRHDRHRSAHRHRLFPHRQQHHRDRLERDRHLHDGGVGAQHGQDHGEGVGRLRARPRRALRPTVGVSMVSRDVMIRPGDLGEPEAGFDSISFKGWSAPLYGAVGIDQAIMSKPGARIESRGRIDLLKKGMGFDMSIAGQGISADDLKRIWPYFIATDARDWFVRNVTAGRVESANMKYAFPAGTLGLNGEDKPIPQNGIFIEMVADGVQVKALDGMAPIDIEGKTRLQMHDSEFTVAGDGGVSPPTRATSPLPMRRW